jgi:hypothetical protein
MKRTIASGLRPTAFSALFPMASNPPSDPAIPPPNGSPDSWDNDWADAPTVSIPITQLMRQRAAAQLDRAAHTALATQADLAARRNALAAQVVNIYLDMMDVPSTTLETQTWENTLDPSVPQSDDDQTVDQPKVKTNQRRLDCRGIQKGDRSCRIPTEALQNRLDNTLVGSLIVELDDDEKAGTILGYVPAPIHSDTAESNIPLEALQPLEVFLETIHDSPSPSSQPTTQPE